MQLLSIALLCSIWTHTQTYVLIWERGMLRDWLMFVYVWELCALDVCITWLPMCTISRVLSIAQRWLEVEYTPLSYTLLSYTRVMVLLVYPICPQATSIAKYGVRSMERVERNLGVWEADDAWKSCHPCTTSRKPGTLDTKFEYMAASYDLRRS